MPKKYLVFYFEDNKEEAAPIKEFLETQYFGRDAAQFSVLHYHNIGDALHAVENWQHNIPDAAFLDRHQTHYTNAGLEICKKLLEYWPNLPIVFLSRLASVEHKIDALGLKVTNYVSKQEIDDHPDRLQYIRQLLLAVIERDPPEDSLVYDAGSLLMDLHREDVQWKGQSVHLNRDDFSILHELTKPSTEERLCRHERLAKVGNYEPRRRGDSLDRTLLHQFVRKRIEVIRAAFAKADPSFSEAWKDKRYGLINVPSKGWRWKNDKTAKQNAGEDGSITKEAPNGELSR